MFDLPSADSADRARVRLPAGACHLGALSTPRTLTLSPMSSKVRCSRFDFDSRRLRVLIPYFPHCSVAATLEFRPARRAPRNASSMLSHRTWPSPPTSTVITLMNSPPPKVRTSNTPLNTLADSLPSSSFHAMTRPIARCTWVPSMCFDYPGALSPSTVGPPRQARLRDCFLAAPGSSGLGLFISVLTITFKVICDDPCSSKSLACGWTTEYMFSLCKINPMEGEIPDCSEVGPQQHVRGIRPVLPRDQPRLRQGGRHPNSPLHHTNQRTSHPLDRLVYPSIKHHPTNPCCLRISGIRTPIIQLLPPSHVAARRSSNCTPRSVFTNNYTRHIRSTTDPHTLSRAASRFYPHRNPASIGLHSPCSCPHYSLGRQAPQFVPAHTLNSQARTAPPAIRKSTSLPTRGPARPMV